MKPQATPLTAPSNSTEIRIPLPPPNVGLPPIRTAETTALGRWLRRSLVAFLVGCGLAGLWWWLSGPADPVPPMPPNIVDPEVRALLENSRRRVLEFPKSGNAWGTFGMILLAQLFDREAERCFIRAAQLDPNDATWPYARANRP